MEEIKQEIIALEAEIAIIHAIAELYPESFRNVIPIRLNKLTRRIDELKATYFKTDGNQNEQFKN